MRNFNKPKKEEHRIDTKDMYAEAIREIAGLMDELDRVEAWDSVYLSQPIPRQLEEIIKNLQTKLPEARSCLEDLKEKLYKTQEAIRAYVEWENTEVLYGCPPAHLLRQQKALQNRKTETVKFYE